MFAGGVIPGLKKTGGLKKIGVDAGAAQPAQPAQGATSKRTSVDEPRSSVVHAAPPKLTAPITEEVVAPLIAPTAIRAPPVPVEEVAASPEPRIPSRAKKPKGLSLYYSLRVFSATTSISLITNIFDASLWLLSQADQGFGHLRIQRAGRW